LHEVVCRCAFRAVVTTNYDPGIVDARMRVRAGASTTGFTTWEDEIDLDRWRTGDVFGDAELPVLFAHGQHNRPDSVVLATTEYRRAYQGKLSQVLVRLVDAGHLVWIGFSFADQRIAAILREIAEQSGTHVDPGTAPRHVAIMPWNPDSEANDPRILAQRAEVGYGAQLILYPAPNGDHTALHQLLSSCTDPRFGHAGDLPTRAPTPVELSGVTESSGAASVPVKWVKGAEPVAHFTGRTEELERLDRWAADPEVSLVGVTAWGGAGKTALVTHWIREAGGTSRRPGVSGVFGWRFYADPSAEHWAVALVEWARERLGINVLDASRPATAVLRVLRAAPLLLVLDGLEVVQEGAAGDGFGRLLDGTLREVLFGVCQDRYNGLVLLTSRFPFADLETFDGGSARILEVPPFTLDEGSALLAAAGGDWLPDRERRSLVHSVDGHALATGVLAGLLAARPRTSDIESLQRELAAATRTSARVSRVLRFYGDRLSESDRYLLAAISLFVRPVPAEAVLAAAKHEAFENRLTGWTSGTVHSAIEERLDGLVSWHHDGSITVHPLIRDTFRPLVLGAARVAVETTLTGIPEGTVTSRGDALRVVEAIELLVDADLWQPADDMYMDRSNTDVWKHLPAARLGERAAMTFVATPGRRDMCATRLSADRLGFYLNEVGLFALIAGDLTRARLYLPMAVRHYHDTDDMKDLSISCRNLAACHGFLGEMASAWDAASEALNSAERIGDRAGIRDSHASLGWLAGLRGDTVEAGKQFIAADQIGFEDDSDDNHLYSLRGIRWAEWLALTGRYGPAQALTERNAEICIRNGWHADAARCDWLLGRLALASGDTTRAGSLLAAASRCFRDGDYFTELATILADRAEYDMAIGDFDAAERHSTEAITIAAPRKLVPAQSAALTIRALIRADQATANSRDLLAQGRDAANAAYRLAIRHQLAWHQLDAMRAHTVLDHADGTDRGWAVKTDALYARLLPPDLDPDPPATVERLVAARKVAKREVSGTDQAGSAG
jgi:hypothetical protein